MNVDESYRNEVNFDVEKCGESVHWYVTCIGHNTICTYGDTYRNVTLMIIRGVRLQLKCDGTRWRTGAEVKGKLANGVGSQYPSHYLGTWCIQHYYRWCAHLGCQMSTELTPRRFKWTRPFSRKKKSGFCACAITFQLASTEKLLTWRLERQLCQPGDDQKRLRP
jgi:hypothetical protein